MERHTMLAPLGLRFRDALSGEPVGDGLSVTIYPTANPSARTTALPNRSGAYVLHSAPGLRDATHGAGDDSFWEEVERKSFTIEVTDARRRYLPFTFEAKLPARGMFEWVWPLEGTEAVGLGRASVSLRDDFDDGQRDATKWRVGTLRLPLSETLDEEVTALEQNGRLEVTPRASQPEQHFNGYVSAATWSVKGARASVEVAQATQGAAETIFTLSLDANNWFRFVAQAGQLLFQSRAGNGETSASVAYDPAQHRWWSFRHDAAGDEVSFETSADGRAWMRRRVVPRQFQLAAMLVELGAGTAASVGAPGAAHFDNFALESNPVPFIPLFSAPARAASGGMAILRAELWNPQADGGKGAPASFALLEASIAGRPTMRGIADREGRIALVFPYPEPSSATDGEGNTLPPVAFTSQEWEVGLRAFYAPPITAPDTAPDIMPLPDLRAVFEQPVANLWSDEARSVPLTKAVLRFGQELVVRSHTTMSGAPLEPVPLPVLLITPAT
jgi:hypothetical protein